MKVSDSIRFSIGKLPKGHVFTYTHFITMDNRKDAVIKVLNRMADSGKIIKLAKGRYYKAEASVFGELPPAQIQIVKDLLRTGRKPTGYLTGYSIYNQLLLTTQISNTIQIGKNEIRPAFKRGIHPISFIKQKNTITKQNIPLLQLLDAIRYIKKIPDAPVPQTCKRLVALLKSLTQKEKKEIVRLAKKYPPSTRALLGALLDAAGATSLTGPLAASLNPVSTYKIYGTDQPLHTTAKWHIQ